LKHVSNNYKAVCKITTLFDNDKIDVYTNETSFILDDASYYSSMNIQNENVVNKPGNLTLHNVQTCNTEVIGDNINDDVQLRKIHKNDNSCVWA